MTGRRTTADRVRERYRLIAEAPHRELDRQLDLALAVDDDRDASRGAWSDAIDRRGPEPTAEGASAA